MGYAALQHRFRVEGEDAAELARAHRLLAAFAQIPDTEADTTYTLGPELTVDLLINELNLAAIQSVPTRLRLHAAALVDDAGRVVVLLGRSGAGKSTLCTALLRSTGLRYLSDEVAAVDPATLDVAGYPKPITLKSGSHPVLPDLHPGTDGPLWQLPPEDIRPHAVGSGGRLALVVTPQRVASTAASTRSLSWGETILAMAENSSYLVDFAAPLQVLSAVASAVPAVELSYTESADAARVVHDLLESL